MADFDESAIRSPSEPVETIRAGDVSPWMVWSAAGTIGALALIGLYLGLHGGHPASGVTLTLARGALLDPATAASATSAVALPKDQQWSTLSGPQILTKTTQAAPKAAASDDDESDAADSAEPAAAAAIDEPEAATPPAQPPPIAAGPAPTTDPQAAGATP